MNNRKIDWTIISSLTAITVVLSLIVSIAENEPAVMLAVPLIFTILTFLEFMRIR